MKITAPAGLNRDKIPSPFGGEWAASTINGNLKRRSGFLYNEAYVGLLVFNRLSMFKDPETGKRVSGQIRRRNGRWSRYRISGLFRTISGTPLKRARSYTAANAPTSVGVQSTCSPDLSAAASAGVHTPSRTAISLLARLTGRKAPAITIAQSGSRNWSGGFCKESNGAC